MSYIMDALKKSEKERGRRKPPRPDAAPAREAARPVRTRVGIYVAAAAILVNACVLAWWLFTPQPDKTSVRAPEQVRDGQSQQTAKSSAPAQAPPALPPASPAPPEPAQTSAAAPVAPPATAPASAPVSGPMAQAPRDPGSTQATAPPGTAGPEARSPIQSAKAAAAPEGAVHGSVAKTPPTTAPHPQPPPRQSTAAGTDRPGPGVPDDQTIKKQSAARDMAGDVAKKQGVGRQPGLGGSRELIMDLKALTAAESQSETTAVSRKAIRYHELSSNVRDSMPRISVSMLLYSKNSNERWINVNGSKMREGQEVSAGLKVEEITSEGAIFNYRGQRFYKAVIGD